MFWFIYRFFDILEFFMGKIIFLTKKKILEITRMTIVLPKTPKYYQKYKMSKKKKKTLKTLKRPKYRRNG